MKTGPLFPLLTECRKRIIILQGGGDSGKTTTALQFFGIDSIQQPHSLTTVTAQDLPNLKGGALRTFQRYVLSDLDPFIEDYNKSSLTYTFKNKSIYEFKSFDDEQDARGSERDNLLANEVNKMSYSLFWQLQRKTRRRIIADYNPTSPFFIHERILSGAEKQFADQYQLYITDHRHNPFLSQQEHDAYESISDPELFRVYARGLTGKVTGLILGHFKKCTAPPEQYDRVCFGLDIGYVNDPTALVKMYVKGSTRWFIELCYKPGMSAQEIKDLLILNGYNNNTPVYSEADPNMINQLRRLAIAASPAIKGPGSVAAGLSKIREHECYYMGENFEKEIMNYKWVEAEDLITGKTVMTNVPVDVWNHLADASRYADYTDYFRFMRVAA
jgi:phage terminase large subunit